MESRMTNTRFCSAILLRCVVQRSAIYTVAMICTGLFLCSPGPAAALPTVDEFMKELRLSDGDKQRILDGKIVDWSASEGWDRELALGMAFLARTNPEHLSQMYRESVVSKEIPVMTARGQITGEDCSRTLMLGRK